MTGKGSSARFTDQNASPFTMTNMAAAMAESCVMSSQASSTAREGCACTTSITRAAQRKRVTGRLRRQQAREPGRRLPAGLVGGRRCLIDDRARGRLQRDLIGANPAEPLQELQHQIRPSDLGIDRRQAPEELRGHAVRRLDFLAHGGPHALHLRGDQHDQECGAEAGHHEIQAGPQSHGAMVPGPAARMRRSALMKIMSPVS